METISHIRENGRVTIMFNAYEGPPRIARLYGKGTCQRRGGKGLSLFLYNKPADPVVDHDTGSVHEFGSAEYNALLPEGIRHAGSRAAVVLDLIKVSTVRDCHRCFSLPRALCYLPDLRLLCSVVRIQIAPRPTPSVGCRKGGHRPRA